LGKKGSHTTLQEVVETNSGLSADELINPKSTEPTEIQNLSKAAIRLLKAINGREEITIFGDYDADGITSSLILKKLIEELGGNPNVMLPKRFSEGYGLSLKAVDKINEGLLITVDNGIAANEAIDAVR